MPSTSPQWVEQACYSDRSRCTLLREDTPETFFCFFNERRAKLMPRAVIAFRCVLGAPPVHSARE